MATALVLWGVLLVEGLRSTPERPDGDPIGGEPTDRDGTFALLSWAPTPAAFSATSLKNETLVFVPGSLNLNYITKEETS